MASAVNIQRRNPHKKVAPLRGQRWIRTTEGVSQQIYSLPHLATLVFALIAYLRVQR